MEIKTEFLPRIVADQDWYGFNVPADGLYCVSITSRCKNWRQNLFRLRFGDDDLAVQIDDFQFFELKGKKREFNSIGSWNGNELKNNRKAVLFVLPLKAGEHKVTFWADKSLEVESVEINALLSGQLAKNTPAGVAALDVVFKNVKVENLTAVNNKKETAQYAVQDAKGGVSALGLQQMGEPAVISIKAKIISGPEKIGWVRLHPDITTQAAVNLRVEPATGAASLVDLADGDEVEIISEIVIGDWISGKSNIWHKIRFRGKEGFVLSSFIEIQGQERDKIIDLITAKCNEKVIKKENEPENKVDANIMLAIAGVESHYKPYAVGFNDEELKIFTQNNNKDEQDVLGARGIFQMRLPAARQAGVGNRFNLYQNINGGVEYYKWIKQNVNGRGNIDEKRLIAWHDGLGNVPKKYDYGKLSGDMQKFIINVSANIKKRDWKRIVLLLVILLAVFVGYGIKRENSIGIAPVVDGSLSLKTESASASSINNIPDMDLTGDSIIFDSLPDGINKIIVRRSRDDRGWSQTKLAYWSGSESISETLEGYLDGAGWRDGFFYVRREAGMHYAPTTLYSAKNGHLEKVKIVEKNGRIRDEFDAPVFSVGANEKIVTERQFATEDVSRNIYIEELKEYRYFPPDNAFYEFKRIREETDVGNG